jgi:hypothetical protein
VGRRIKLRFPNGEAQQLLVQSFDAEAAVCESTRFDAEGKEKGEPKSQTIKFDELGRVESTRTSNGKTTVVSWDRKGTETITVEAGAFACGVYESEDGKAWLSEQWPSLMVRVTEETGEVELVEFDLGHDGMRFYRTAGNFYVLRSTTSFGGMDIESEMRMEVKSVKDGKAKYSIVSMDANGNEQMNSEQTMDVPAKEGVTMPYEDQVEETVTVAAGTFRCIKTEVEGSGMTMWMHHGIIVKSTMSSDNIKMTQELTELKME